MGACPLRRHVARSRRDPGPRLHLPGRGGVACLHAALEAVQRPGPGGGLTLVAIMGYADRLAVRPCETIEFKVSVESDAARYRADIVRLICGDDRPEGPGFKVQEIVADI